MAAMMTFATAMPMTAMADDVQQSSVTVENGSVDETQDTEISDPEMEDSELEIESEGTSGTCGENLTLSLNSDGKIVISGTGAMADYEYDNASPWNSYKANISSVEIQNGVTSIGSYAFSDCTIMAELSIPDSVTTVGGNAFRECSSLTSVTIPDSVTSIGLWSFEGCKSLKKIDISNSIVSIPMYAFSDCTSLTELNIPESVTTLEAYAFSGCSSLTSVTIPDNVTLIGWGAFLACSNLTSIEIPDSTTISGRAFLNCYNLKSIKIPSCMTSIDFATFLGCTSLTDVTIPDNITSIANSAFSGCSNLKSITIPGAVTSIGSNAFRECSSDLVISAYASTAAEAYANANGMTFSPLLGISSQPASAGAEIGDTVQFKVDAYGTGLSYQWYYKTAGASNWKKTSVKGYKTSAITMAATAARNGNSYRCVITDANGKTVTSEAATLTVSAAKPIVISQQPKSVTASGGNVTMTVAAKSNTSSKLSYQWYYKTAGSSSWKKTSVKGYKTSTITMGATAALTVVSAN